MGKAVAQPSHVFSLPQGQDVIPLPCGFHAEMCGSLARHLHVVCSGTFAVSCLLRDPIWRSRLNFLDGVGTKQQFQTGLKQMVIVRMSNSPNLSHSTLKSCTISTV